MLNRKLIMVVFALFFSATTAIACGIYMPWQLLGYRDKTLKSPVANSFWFEMTNLLSPKDDKFKAIEDQGAAALEKAEASDLNSDQINTLAQMRSANSGEQAYIAGSGIATAARLYTAGAVDYHKGNFIKALSRFQAILQLPESEQKSRNVWASFMIGKIYAHSGEPLKAAAAFKQTRDLVAKGAVDDLGLAVASYGEEAKIYWRAAGGQIGSNGRIKNQALFANQWNQAAHLYSQQASYQSLSGVDSLRIMAKGAWESDAVLSAVLTTPLGRRIMVDYALADPSAHGKNVALTKLFRAVNHYKADQSDGDRLAALAYSLGDYQNAAALANHSQSPMALWIRAKIATQKNQLNEAASLYAQAAKAFPTDHSASGLSPNNAKLLIGEEGVLSLSRGNYIEAMQYLLQVSPPYWGDAAYIAERVLTIDELKAFVEANGKGATQIDPATSLRLRDLLARRLVRDNKIADAIPYFHTSGDADVGFHDPDAKDHAILYQRALTETGKSSGVDQAKAWYQAALAARTYGLDIMGSELSPDFFMYRGNFAWYGLPKLNNPTLVTSGEKDRFAASAVDPDLRFHYRYIAANQALRSADLLPKRSQAFAAVLCKAEEWMQSTHSIAVRNAVYMLDADGIVGTKHEAEVSGVMAQKIYRRYIKEGPYQPWAARFGQSCPEPDFNGAAHFERNRMLHKWLRFMHRHMWATALVLLVLAGIIGTVIYSVRKKKSKPNFTIKR